MWLKPRSAFITLLFICSTLFVTAQDTTIDSLRATVQSAVKDQTKLKAYVLLTGKLSLISFNETLRIGEEGFGFTFAMETLNGGRIGTFIQN